MLKKCLLVFLLSLSAAASVVAQGLPPMPFTNRPVSKEQYAKAIATDDQTVLNVPCERLVAAAQQVRQEPGFSDCRGLAAYVMRLNVKTCPNVETTIARVLPDESIDLYGRTRELRFGEQCLFDNNEARWFASLSCGNFITGKVLPVFTAMINEKIPREGEERPEPSPSSATPIAHAAAQAAAHTAPDQAKAPSDEEYYQRKRHPWYSPKRKTGLLLWGGVGAGAAVCAAKCPWSTQTVTQTVIVNR